MGRIERFFIFACLTLASHALAADWTPVSLPSTEAKESGITWYRTFIRVPADMTATNQDNVRADSVAVNIAGIGEPYAIYLNGQKIDEGSAAIPDDAPRRVKIQKGILEKGKFNVLAIRLDAKAAGAGIHRAPLFLGYWDELTVKSWEVYRGDDVDPKAMKPLDKQPAVAAYVESDFHMASTPLAAAEPMRGVRMSPALSMATMKTPGDVRVELVAAEPDAAQPTHISFDERGRMWVSQYKQYPYPAGVKQISRDKYYRARFNKVPPAPPHQDRGADSITVFEDTNGDGTFDKKKVVLEGLNMANAAVRGHGGLWVMNTPYLVFYPDADGDDVPDREPEVRLAGFGLEDAHSVANGLIWGPDGWLYGVQGSGTTARIVRPGIDPPNFPGVYSEGCIVWRYHPEKKTYEVFSEGGGNNFGLDFDAEGRIFCGDNGDQTAGWHFVQSGIYAKGMSPDKYGPPRNPSTFGPLKKMASAQSVQRFRIATTVFEGNALPPRYFGHIIGCDALHRKLVSSKRIPSGSTFSTADTDTPLSASDIAFRPVYVTNGADGALYIADFYEEFIAHGQHYQSQIDNSTGRIYRLRGKDASLNRDVDLSKKSTDELVKTLSHTNRWHRMTAVRLLGERRDANAVAPLKTLLQQSATHPALESLWALYQLGAFDEDTARAALAHPAAHVRAWAIRLAGDAKKLSPGFLDDVVKLGKTEPNSEVRQQIASTSRHLPADQALALASAVLKRDADAGDSAIPMLCWWTIESHCDTSRAAVMSIAKDPGAWPSASMRETILPRLMRRLATLGKNADYLDCATLLRSAPSDEFRKPLMAGFEEAFKGRALPALPNELGSALAASGHASTALRVRLGETEAVAAALKQLEDRKGETVELITLITLFGEVKTPRAAPILLAIAREDAQPEVRKAALTSLMLYPDDSIGPQVAGFYANLPNDVRPAAVNLLASRPTWAGSLLELVKSKKMKRDDVPPDVVARLKGDADAHVSEQANALFPAPAPTGPEAKRVELDRIKRIIDSAPGDIYKGEAIFMQRCAACHTLFYKGGQVGPNLTEYQREDLGTMLPSILDPGLEVREGFESYILRTKDGRSLSGYLVENDAAVVVIRGTDGQDVRVPRDRIDKLKPTGGSLMPDDILKGLDDQQIRNFFAYLRIPQPITQ